jgi:DNA-binding PadR family transcriptional regulator
VSSTSHAWDDLNDAVLAVFTSDMPRTSGDIRRAQPGVPDSYIRAALHHLTDLGYLAAARGAVHTTYRITEAGARHLTNTMKVA